jgi:large subunit ribosomal protein L11
MSEEKKVPQVKFNKFNVYVVVGGVMGSPGLPAALGPKGIQLKAFVDEFNKTAKTLGLKQGSKVSANVAYQKGGRFQIIKVKSSSVSQIIKEKADLKTASQKPGINIVGSLSMKDAMEIANQKMADMNAASVESALKTVIGTAKSMGINII